MEETSLNLKGQQKGELTMLETEGMLGGALAQVAGPLKDFAEKLGGAEGEQWLHAFNRFLRKEEAWKKHIIDLDANPFVPNGWKIEEHIKGGQMEWDPTKVALYLSTGQQNGKTVSGNQLREELKGKNPYNANLLDYLLAHPELIPEEWKGKFIFFFGTIHRDPGGSLHVRCLHWYGDRWYWHFHRLDSAFGVSDPAAVPASS